jgi:hypothetical protein
MTSGVEFHASGFFERDGKPVGNVRHYLDTRERFHWGMDPRCELCAARERVNRAQQEYDLVERRYWEVGAVR